MSWNDVNVGREGVTDHWNFPKGSVLKVVTYTNASAVELIVNGKSLGIRCNDAVENRRRNIVEWDGIEYDRGGEIKAVALDEEGKAIAEHVMHTAGRPSSLAVTQSKRVMAADGRDLMYLDVTAVDRKGNRVPGFAEELTVSVEGAGMLLALDDADHYTELLFEGVDTKKMRNGRMQVIIRATHTPGPVKVRLTTPTLKKTHTFMAE